MKRGFFIGLTMLAAVTIAGTGASPSLAQTSASTERVARATVELDGMIYQFEGTCQLTARGNAKQFRLAAPGAGPEGQAVFLTAFSAPFTPTQYIIHGGATSKQAREAAMVDDRTVWHVKGAAAQDATEFADDGVRIEGVADVSEGDSIISKDVAIVIAVEGC